MKVSKLIIGILIFAFIIGAVSLTAPDSMAFDYMGKCGDNLTYFYVEGGSYTYETVDENGNPVVNEGWSGGQLYIVGSGSMYNYSSSDPAPWHSAASSIETIQFSYDVTSVGDYAFADCGNLSSMSGAFSVYTIGSHAFDGCYSIQRMPPYASYVGSYAFKNCSSLGTGYCNGSGLGEGAFYGCSSMTSVNLSGSISKIPDYAFYGCYSLGSIDIPDDVTYIGESAFESCSSLSSVDIPEGVEEIGADAFKECSSLSTFSIPGKINEVPEGLLSGCKRLQTLTMHDGVTKFGDYAFEKCASLMVVRFPETVKEMGEGVFSGCSALSSVIFNKKLTNISEKAFSECTSLKHIDLPDYIETIGIEAFSGCTAIKELELDEGLKTIEDRAFADCTGLTVCVLPTSIRSVGESVFKGCTSLRSVRYAGYLAKWKNVVVGVDNPLLSDDKISTDYIDGGNLVNGNVWSVSVDGALNIGGDGAMQNFEEGAAPWHKYSDTITSVTIDNKMPYIGAFAFADLENLRSAVLPDALTRVSDGMFKNCNKLQRVEGTKNIKNIGASAFENCFSLSIDMPTVVTLGDRAFANCGGVGSIDLSCEKIGAGAFENCVDLKEVIIRNTVQEIGDGAFSGCSIELADYVGTEEELAYLKTGINNEALTDVLSISYYVKNIYVGAGPSKKAAKASIGNKTSDIIQIDVDPDRSQYVCIAYSLTNDITEAITDIKLYSTSARTPDGSVTRGDITYYLLSKPVRTDENGLKTYICTTKDVSAGEPVIMIGVRNDDSGKGSFTEGESWTAVTGLNSETNSLSGELKNIRLYYTNDPDADLNQPIGNPALTASIIAIGVSVLGGLAILLYMKSHKDKTGKQNTSAKEQIRALSGKVRNLFKKDGSAKENGKNTSKAKSGKPDRQQKKAGKKSSKKEAESDDRDPEKAETGVQGKHENSGKSHITSLKGKHVNQKPAEKKTTAADGEAPEKEAAPGKAKKNKKSKKSRNPKKDADTAPLADTDTETEKEPASVK